MDKIIVKSKLASAGLVKVGEVDDIIIRETSTTRLLLRPIIVENMSDPEACVKGAIIFQKAEDGQFKETDKAFSLSNVKKGQFCKLDLKSAEVLTILQKYDMLRQLYKKEGMSFGQTTFIIPDSDLEDILIELSNFDNKDRVLEALKKIQFWQKEFMENTWVLGQIFACPYVHIHGKPYLGGKAITNRGGTQSDFIMKQTSSENIAFVEIKTPVKCLMANSLYRGKLDDDRNSIYSLSEELSGSINQVFNQRDVFLEKKIALEGDCRNYKNPKCIIVIGNKEQLKPGQLRNFDLFRYNSPNLEIITFDELFERINSLKKCFIDE